MEVAGLNDDAIAPARRAAAAMQAAAIKVAPIIDRAAPSDRVLRLRRDRCAVENCDDAVRYLASRHLWPLPPGCTLRAHPTVEYYSDEGKPIGRYPALVADVLDVAGQLVTVHVTWLHYGKKLDGHQPRKLLSKMTGRVGCAVQLMPAGDVLGVAEGVETALSAALMHGVPVWAALNTSLLARFEPPPGVTTLRVYADRDEAGLTAALKLVERLQGRVRLEIRIPPAPAKDWNDFLVARNTKAAQGGGEGALE
jgi:putative DNA primase/helicase